MLISAFPHACAVSGQGGWSPGPMRASSGSILACTATVSAITPQAGEVCFRSSTGRKEAVGMVFYMTELTHVLTVLVEGV